MKEIVVLVVFIFLLFCTVFCLWMQYRYVKKSRLLARVLHEHACMLLHVDGYPRRVDYSQIPKLWSIYKKENPNLYLFIDLAANVIAKQIKECSSFDKIVDYLNGFELMVKEPDLADGDDQSKLIKKIHKKVADLTISRVVTLAQSKCHRIRLMPKSKEKKDLENRFKEEISIKAFSSIYYPNFSFDFFMQKERQKLLEGKKNKTEDNKAKIVTLPGNSSTAN